MHENHIIILHNARFVLGGFELFNHAGLVTKARELLNSDALITLCYSFISHYLCYCNHVLWITPRCTFNGIPCGDDNISIISTGDGLCHVINSVIGNKMLLHSLRPGILLHVPLIQQKSILKSVDTPVIRWLWPRWRHQMETFSA